jgi:hypothetical protein
MFPGSLLVTQQSFDGLRCSVDYKEGLESGNVHRETQEGATKMKPW